MGKYTPSIHADIVVNNTTDEAGSIQIYGKNADALILGDATHEGGDISVYRNASGNKQVFIDADAASNAIGMSVYGGVVAQHYLTVGQATLNTDRALHVGGGQGWFVLGLVVQGSAITILSNISSYGDGGNLDISSELNISTSKTAQVRLQIDDDDVIVISGTGTKGSHTSLIGLYGGTPTTQAAAISDPAESIAGNNAAIDAILVALRNISLIAT